MMAGAGGAMRATGRRATAIRFQQFGEGQLNVELSLPIFRLALAVFIPWPGADGIRPALGMAPALMVCWIEGGAGFFSF